MRGYHLRIVLCQNRENNSREQFIPASLFQHLPDHPRISPNSRTPDSPKIHSPSDYRFGPLIIDWMDFDHSSQLNHVGKEKGVGRGPAEGTFVPLTRHKSGTTDLTEGVVHVYRDSANKPSVEELEVQLENWTLQGDLDDGVVLAVLAVPAWMTPSDFLAFTAPAADGIAHLRIIRDFAPNRSIAVIKFLSPANASEFAEEYNGKPFNSMEPEICHIVHVLSVVIDVEDSVTQALSRSNSADAVKYELPTCPVCLERMDSAVTGLITVPCSHTFHCMCLSKWGDSRCPVCRYSQTLLSSHPTSSSTRATRSIPFADPSSSTLSSCATCFSTTNLWICLICGNIGCGRYGQAHAQEHYQATTHLYALELETQRVWDYAGDGYVHRLIQNKADGKLVELPSAASSMGVTSRDGGLGPSQADALSAEKIEAIGIEYSYLLTSQLDSQRAFYEEQATELKEQLADLRSVVARLTLDFETERSQAKEDESNKLKEQADKLAETIKAKDKAEEKAKQRVDKATELARKFEKELRDEKAVSEGLMTNLAAMKERIEHFNRDKEVYSEKVRELEDQVRDVMFSLEAKTKIERGGGVEAEAAGGSIEVPTLSPPKLDGKKKKTRKG